jgi:pilus assembly protein FimV
MPKARPGWPGLIHPAVPTWHSEAKDITMRGMRLRLHNFLVLLAMMLPAAAGAVSFGDELVMSRLGDPVEIEIEILQWQDIDLDRVQIGVGSAAEYDTFGLVRLPVLDTLNFNLVGPDSNGRLKLLVSNREPVQEPFLELLMVMRWPGGSLLREYVLLFDPPGLEPPVVELPELSTTAPEPAREAATVTVVVEEATPAVTLVEAELATADPVVAPPPANSPVRSVPAQATEPATEAAPVPTIRNQLAIEVDPVPTRLPPRVPSNESGQTGRQRYRVQSGDSLWDIARSQQNSNLEDDLYKFLVSLHDLNREAFINGNISLLKSGAVLQIPSGRDMSQVDRAAARDIFEQRWAEGTQRYELALQGASLPLFSEAYENSLVDAAEPASGSEPQTGADLETTEERVSTSLLRPASETTLVATNPRPVDLPVSAQEPATVPVEPAETPLPDPLPQAADVIINQQPMPAPAAEAVASVETTPVHQTPVTGPVVAETAVADEPLESPVLEMADEAPAGFMLPVALEQFSDKPYITDITLNVESIEQLLAVRQERLDAIAMLTLARDEAVMLANVEIAALQNRLAMMRGASVTGMLTVQNEQTLALVMVMLTLLGIGMILRETGLARYRHRM